MSTYLTPWRFPCETVSHASSQFAKKKRKSTCVQVQRPSPSPTQVQVHDETCSLHWHSSLHSYCLQVDDYWKYMNQWKAVCWKFGQNSVISGHPNAFSNRFSCRLATTPGKSAIAMWINIFREHGAIHNLSSKISSLNCEFKLEIFGSSKYTGTPGNMTKLMESVAKSLTVNEVQKVSLQTIPTAWSEPC